MRYAEYRSQQFGMTRCPNCPKSPYCPPIPPDGPPNSRVMLIGEQPGKEENSRGRCFIGKTGQEMNEHYLPLSGLQRDFVYMTNACKCFTGLNTDSTQFKSILQSCALHHLAREILTVRPEVIVPMGAVACSLVEGLDLEMRHGIPMEGTNWWGHEAATFPTWHPALGLHKTDMILQLRQDFLGLGKFLRGEFQVPIDPYAGREDYADATTADDVYSELECMDRDAPIFIDTESDPVTGFWCLSFSSRAGFGRMVRRESPTTLDAFRSGLRRLRGPVVFHNGLYDVPVLEEVGIQFPMRRFDDTMVRAYHLGWLPQGLKFLAFRLCGMYMEEYEDVVLPHSNDVRIDYILKLAGVDWPKPSQEVVLDKGEFKLKQPRGLNTKLKLMLTHYQKNPSHKIFKRWDEWSDEEKLPAIQQFGDLPRPSIQYVPLPKATWYACRDADATGRVRAKLIELKRGIRGYHDFATAGAAVAPEQNFEEVA